MSLARVHRLPRWCCAAAQAGNKALQGDATELRAIQQEQVDKSTARNKEELERLWAVCTSRWVVLPMPWQAVLSSGRPPMKLRVQCRGLVDRPAVR